MDAEYTSKIDEAAKVSKMGKKAVKSNNSNKKAKTSNAKGGIQKKQSTEKIYKQPNKKTLQRRLAPHPDPLHVRAHQLWYDVRLQLDKIMEEPESTVALVAEFKELFKKIKEEESSAILYPYSTTSSTVPIMEIARLPNTYT